MALAVPKLPLFQTRNTFLSSGIMFQKQPTSKIGMLAVQEPVSVSATAVFYQAATISYATHPCLKNRSKYKDRKQANIQRQQKKKEVSTVESGPAPCKTMSESHVIFAELQNFLKEEKRKLSVDRQARIAAFQQIIEDGSNPTPYELKEAVYATMQKTGRHDAWMLYKVLGNRFIQSPDFFAYFGLEIQKVSEETLVDIENESETILRQGHTKWDRHEKAILEDLPFLKRKEYLDQYRKAMFEMIPETESIATGASMLPTLPERVITRSALITSSNVNELAQKGLIVSSIIPKFTGKTVSVMKRLTALENDTVDFRGKQVLVPKGHCWLLGDNAQHSYDSRYHGAVPLSNLRKVLIEAFVPDSAAE